MEEMEEAWEESYHPAAPSSSAASSSTSFWPGHYTALLPPVPGGVGAGSVPMSWGFPEDRAMWLSQAWDEEYSMAAELEEEMQIEPPGPADLPLPFGTAAELTMNNTEHGHEAAVVDWLELVRDKRVLRGGRRLGCVVERRTGEPTFSTSSSSSSAASSSSTSPWDGEGATRDDVQLGTSPGSSTTSAPPNTYTSSASTSSSSATPRMDGTSSSSEEGLIKRWGVFRPGRDRWHNPNGTVKKRGTEPTLVPVPEEPEPGDFMEEVPFDVVECCEGSHVLW